MNSTITRDELIDLLKSLVDERRTSTLYVHTDENHLIAVGIDRGEIVSLICGPKRGERAIPLIRKMRTGTFRLDDELAPHRGFGARLPPIDTLLSLLSEEGDDEISDCRWVQEVLCKVLAEYMGPIAPLVCRDTVQSAGGIDSPAKVKRVVAELAKEIDNAAESDRFLAQARAELGNLLR